MIEACEGELCKAFLSFNNEVVKALLLHQFFFQTNKQLKTVMFFGSTTLTCCLLLYLTSQWPLRVAVSHRRDDGSRFRPVVPRDT